MKMMEFRVSLFLSALVALVSGDYELDFTLHSISNPQGRCADTLCNPSCPDGACQYFFNFCFVVSFDHPAHQPTCSLSERVPESGVLSEGSDITAPDLVSHYSGGVWPQEGIFFKLLDASSQGDILVDRFVVNITDIPIGSTSDRTYLGIFGLASVDIRIALVCLPGYIGPDCSTECHNETCTCPPGFTGPFCATSITQNCSVNCSGEGDDHTTTSDITSPDLDNNSHENHTTGSHTANTAPTSSSTMELPNDDSQTTILMLVVLVGILLLVVALVVTGFSLFLCLKWKRAAKVRATMESTSDNNFQMRENLHPLSLPSRGMDSNYDNPNALLSSNSYVNNTLNRDQANGGTVNVSLAPSPAYSPVYSEVRDDSRSDPPCIPCPAYNVPHIQLQSSIGEKMDVDTRAELENSEHIYY